VGGTAVLNGLRGQALELLGNVQEAKAIQSLAGMVQIERGGGCRFMVHRVINMHRATFLSVHSCGNGTIFYNEIRGGIATSHSSWATGW